jgi:WD40 repeat protein
MALSPDGRTLAVGSHDRTVTLWSSADSPASQFETEPGGSSILAFSQNGKELVTAGQGAVFAVRDLAGRVLRALVVSKVNSNSAITAAAFSRGGRRFATAHNETTMSLWDPQSWKEIYNGFVRDAATMAAVFSPDGQVLATAQHGKGVHIWDSESGRLLAVAPDSEPLESLAFSPDGRLLAAGRGDGVIRLWKTDTGIKMAGRP